MLAVERVEVAALNDAARAALRDADALGDDIVEVAGRGFALGERVVCLRNDRRLGILNGTTGTVLRAVGQGLMISTDDGIRWLPAPYLHTGHLGYGYALGVHKAQGLTVERAFVLATAALTREAAYVAMSRARESTELFVAVQTDLEGRHDPRAELRADPLGELKRRLATSRAKQLAHLELEGEGITPSRNDDSNPSATLPARLGVGQSGDNESYRGGPGARGVGDAAIRAQPTDRSVREPEPAHPRASEHQAESSPWVLERLRLAERAARVAYPELEAHRRDRGRSC
jgi:hypothetical protein